jgi:CheY-like chemotaxis protein
MEMPDSKPSTAPLIVVVEDDEATREVVQIVVENETPYRTLLITNGKETLHRLEEVKQAGPSLFLLDFQLPFMNALDLYDKLHAIPELRAVPAIIMTASTVSGMQQEAIAARHIEICWKPFEVQDLIDCIERALNGS